MFWKDYQQTKNSQTPSLEQTCSLFGQQQRTTHQGIPEANPFFRQKHSNYGCFIERDQILMNLFFFMNLNSLQLQNLEEVFYSTIIEFRQKWRTFKRDKQLSL